MLAYIGLGSNLAAPLFQIRGALLRLARLPKSVLLGHAPLYRNQALIEPGSAPQPDYINTVAAVSTGLSAWQLLRRLQYLEYKQGRRRGPGRWEARTLDLDLLLYGKLHLKRKRLTLPHPRLHERQFALQPLSDLNPNLVIPGCGKTRLLRSKKLKLIRFMH